MNLRMFRRPAVISLALACSAATWWGCTASNGNNGFTTATGAGGSASAASGSGGSGHADATTGAGGDEISIDAGADADQPLDDAGVCAATSAQASLIPLDMVILVDESGSMAGTKWTGITASLKTFINDPASAGIGVGAVYFPVDVSEDCNFPDYANLNVPIGTLPMNAPALIASIDSEEPQGVTPTFGALKGALFAATTHQDANPTHKVIVVIATDGDPTSCSETGSAPIAALAQSAFNYNGVQTYAIAVAGSTIANLDAIALAGGTKKAFDVTQNIDAFSQKMAEIRASALACDFVIPPPPDAEQLDPQKVNLSYTPGGQGTAKSLPRADDLADCGGKAGWYYDNNVAPTKILLCPASCQVVQEDSKAAISVLFGCTTVAN
jgi:Mg-chelatase subunit ChlD